MDTSCRIFVLASDTLDWPFTARESIFVTSLQVTSPWRARRPSSANLICCQSSSSSPSGNKRFLSQLGGDFVARRLLAARKRGCKWHFSAGHAFLQRSARGWCFAQFFTAWIKSRQRCRLSELPKACLALLKARKFLIHISILNSKTQPAALDHLAIFSTSFAAEMKTRISLARGVMFWCQYSHFLGRQES